MSSVGKLSSYFTARRRDVKPDGEATSTSGGPSVRARLEKKLQVRQKTGFAFNFALDGDRDSPENGETGQGSDADEHGSFRFGFTPVETSVEVGEKTACKEKPGGGGGGGGGGGVGGNQQIAPGFHVDGEERRTQAPPNTKKKKKGSGKKKTKGKGKGKTRVCDAQLKSGGECRQEIATTGTHPVQIAAATALTGDRCHAHVAKPIGVSNFSVEKLESQPPGAPLLTLNSPAVAQRSTSPVRSMARPPPGFTLESWKDPALSVEERRRRRFGRGVRNMAAIQRSRDARRGAATNEDLPAEAMPEDQGRGAVRADDDRAGRGGSEANEMGAGDVSRPSVFAFGFDIGISFNGS